MERSLELEDKVFFVSFFKVTYVENEVDVALTQRTILKDNLELNVLPSNLSWMV